MGGAVAVCVAISSLVAVILLVGWYATRKRPKSLKKIERLARSFVDHLAQKYPQNPKIVRLRRRVYEARFQEVRFGGAGYSENKGDTIALCVREGVHNEVVFVMVHELAHVMTNDWGHTRRFWRNFSFLLREAETFGMYRHVDYQKNPTSVCGDPIEFSPHDVR